MAKALSELTPRELTQLEEDLVRRLSEAQSASPDRGDIVDHPEYVSLPEGPDQHVAIFARRKAAKP